MDYEQQGHDTQAVAADPSVHDDGLQNAVESGVVQAKLAVGRADDRFEREADDMAAQVVAVLAQGVPSVGPFADDADGPSRVRRKSEVGPSVGDQATLAHELTHTSQQGAAVRRSPSRVQRSTSASPTGLAQRKNGDEAPKVTAVKRSDYTGVLEAIVSTFVPDQIAKGKVTVVKYIARGLGAGGVSKLRSTEVKAFREKMKTAARAQILEDINELLEDDGTFEDSDVIKSEATQAFLSDASSSAAYKPAKKSVDRLMEETAKKWTDQHFNVDAILAVASEAGRNAAWDVLKANPTKKATQKAAQKAGQAASRKLVKFHTEGYLTQARSFKNSIVKPDNAIQAQNQEDMAERAKDKVSEEKVGEKKLTEKIEAFSAGGALAKLGTMLDAVIPLPGDSVALNITLSIPTGVPSVNVLIKLDGKAGRGITGFSTTGVTTLGNKKRLEIYASLQFGAGVEVFGVTAELTAGIFTRAGSDKGTGATMTALTYAAYRGINDINQKAGAAWGLHDIGGRQLPANVRAEMWAAAVEANIFDDEDDGTFGDVGAMLAAGVSADLTLAGTGVEAAFGGADELSKRFDTASLKDSLGTDFAKSPKTPQEASNRGKKVSGRSHVSFAINGSAGVKIAGQGVTFTAAFSTEHAWGAKEDSWGKNWGFEATAGITMQNGSAIDLIAAGLVTGVTKCIHSVVAIAKTKGESKGPALDLMADATKLTDAGMNGAISKALGDIAKSGGKDVFGVESALTLAVTFGRAGGKAVFRVEIRESKTAKVSVGVVSVAASKTTRLAAIGLEDGGPVVEMLGLRAGKNQ